MTPISFLNKVGVGTVLVGGWVEPDHHKRFLHDARKALVAAGALERQRQAALKEVQYAITMQNSAVLRLVADEFARRGLSWCTRCRQCMPSGGFSYCISEYYEVGVGGTSGKLMNAVAHWACPECTRVPDPGNGVRMLRIDPLPDGQVPTLMSSAGAVLSLPAMSRESLVELCAEWNLPLPVSFKDGILTEEVVRLR